MEKIIIQSVRIPYIEHRQMTNVRGVTQERKGVLSTREVDEMLKEADNIKSMYFSLRAKALISIFKTGKRRASVAALEVADLEKKGDYLYITFTVVKKRKKDILSRRRTKRFKLSSRYAQNILAYLDYLQTHHSECKFMFPSIHSVFGLGYAVSEDRHLSGRQILRIVKQLNPKAWCHLFRETRGAEIVKKDESEKGEASILTVYRVKRALDLESEATAWRYINRYATETIEDEELDII